MTAMKNWKSCQFHLHPLDLKEIHDILKPEDSAAELEKLLNVGGFPEPFLTGERRFYNRWEKSHLDIILKQDLIDLPCATETKE